MKAIYFPALWHAAGALALTFAIAACVPADERPEPAPTPVAAPAPAPAPAPIVREPEYANYLDAPQTPGDWRYVADPRMPVARFGQAASAVLELRCDATARHVVIARASATNRSRAMSIATETVTRELVAEPVRGSGFVVARIPANDPLLDAMAVTKGRFSLEVEGEPSLYIPAWVEVSRVIEDCR